MPANWRDQVGTKSWRRIKHWELSDDDKDELMDILAERVPRVTRGEGLDVFQDYAESSELQSDELQEAAWLLEELRNRPNRGRPSYFSNWLQGARKWAMTVAGEEGLCLFDDDENPRDINDIFVYFDRDGKVAELREDIAQALIEKRDEMMFHRIETPPSLAQDTDRYAALQKVEDWTHKYPWRGVQPLWRMAQYRWFGINTRLDRALMLFMLCDLLEVEGGTGMEGFAFEAGRHFEALHWKRHEPAALRHYQTVAQNRKMGMLGGQAEKKRERYRVLGNLARENLQSFQFATDVQAFRKAKELAVKYDKGSAEPLFVQGGKPLSRTWFEEWLAQFRHEERQASEKQ